MGVGTEVINSGGTPPTGGLGVLGAEQSTYPSFGASAISVKPDEYQSTGRNMGHYSISAATSAIAPTAAAIMFAMRWADPSALCIIKRVRAGIGIVAAVTAQAAPDLDLIVARAYSVRDGTGATVVAITNDTGKARQQMGPSVFATSGNIDITSAAGGVTGGTKTADASPMAILTAAPNVFSIGGGTPMLTLWDQGQVGMHPLVLRANEGILIRTPTAISTGTVKVYVAVDWLEATGY